MKKECHEGGFVVLEFLLSLPVLVLIVLGLCFGVTAASRNYLVVRAQEEVQREVQLAMVRVVDDCMSGTSLRRGSTEESVRIYSGDRPVAEYLVNEDAKHVRKLVKNMTNFPITGNHEWALVVVTSFGFAEVDPVERPGLYRIWLEAKSKKAGGVPYRLTTEIYLPQAAPGGIP